MNPTEPGPPLRPRMALSELTAEQRAEAMARFAGECPIFCV